MNRRKCLLCLGMTLLLLAPEAGRLYGMVRDYAIQIDGNIADWAPVRYDPENYITDPSGEQGDPDQPGSSDRDMRAFAATWDSNQLCFYFRRTFSGSNSLTLLVYMDVNHDGFMDGSDRIARFDFNGSAPGPRALYSYLPAGQADAMTGNGTPLPGSTGSQLAATMNSAATASGIEFECSITWASLGLPPGTPLILHPSIATGLNLPGQVYDNGDVENTQYCYVGLSGARQTATAAGNIASFPHTLTNKGNGPDTFDISATTVNSRAIYYHTDPNGDGDISDGILLALDSNGDGDFLDRDDMPPVIDTNGNKLPDTGVLAAGQSFSFVLLYKAPAGLPNGVEETISVVARSGLNLNRSVFMDDVALVGDLCLAPDQDKTSRAGVSVNLSHRVYNTTSHDDVVNLTAVSALGWPVTLMSDPDGDGTPADGAELADTNGDSIADVGVVPAGGCVALVAVVQVPAGAAPGTGEAVTLMASFAGTPSTTEIASDSVSVAAPVMLFPDRALNVRPGESVFLSHTLQSALPAPEAFALSGASSLGSHVAFWTDPDRDGIMGDGWIATTTEPLAASGGTSPLVVQIDLSYSTTIGSSDSVSLTARAVSDLSVSAGATDTLNVVGCRTYANAIFSYPSDRFYGCATVYAKAGGLASKEYRFVWNDQNLGNGAERVSPSVTPDEVNECDDSIEIGYADMPGTWEVKLQIKQGSGWADVAGWTYMFLVEDAMSGSGAIDTLYSSDLNYELSGDSVTVVSRLYNQSDIVYFRETTVNYVIFLDSNSDGLPTAGEPYLLGSGTPGPWAAGLLTKSSGPVTLFPYQTYFDLFTIPSVTFPQSGAWSLYCGWTTPCGTLIDEQTFLFDVGCAMAPVAEAGPGAILCPGSSTVIGSPAQPRLSYRWDPAAGLSDPTAAQPVAAPAQTTVYTLTVTDIDSGCGSADNVRVTVAVPPQPAINASASVLCVGGEVVLDAGAGFASYRWATGETTRTITVSPQTTTQYCVTVTDDNGCQGSACGQVTVSPLPTVDIAAPASAVCLNETITLDAGPGHASYLWRTGQATQTISVSPRTTTQYCVTVTDPSGCSAEACKTIAVNPLPSVAVSPQAPVICLTHSVELDAGAGFASYLWSTGATSQKITVAPTADAPYTCTVTDGNGCENIASVFVTVLTPAQPANIGNSLWLVKAGSGATFFWASVPDVASYRIKDADRKDFSDASVRAEVSPAGSAMSHDDPDPFAGTVAYFRVAGVNCAQIEGP